MNETFQTVGAVRGKTVRITIGDLSQKLTDLIDAAMGTDVNWDNIIAIELHVETYDCRIAFGCEATTTLGGLRYVGQRERIPNVARVQSAEIINAVAGSASILQIDIEY
jgi:hypothetical protein